MALPAAFLDELRARTPLQAVIGRKVKLARSGRQWKGCCPFHGEKSPSFYVYDDHFHCFGCGAHGDAVGFVMQSDGASFPEAVERLAAEAGLDVPKPTAGAAEAERRRLDLHEVTQAASDSFRRRLMLPEGRAALDYLRARGLTLETVEKFGLGWSGEGRGALAVELGRQGVTEARLIEAGLMREGERGAYDLFFNRVIFPIRDRRGRVISFGGRTLGDGQPKYVNGPETPLFSKRRSLYGLDLARAAVHAGAEAVAVEGYMDVIALHQAGFGGAVAPLGTALTEEQLSELWKLAPAPVLCFDGDAAGGRAAARAAALALPLLGPERTLRIATLPAGEDPDTLVRQGAAGFAAVLAGARPLAEALFDLLREGGDEATPEGRAAFRHRLEDAAGRIPDKALAGEYRRALLDRFFARPRTGGARARAGERRPAARFVREAVAGGAPSHERARILTAILLRHPALLHDVAHAYEGLHLEGAPARLRDALLAIAAAADHALDSEGVISQLSHSGIEGELSQVFAASSLPLPACARPDAMPAEAEAGWWHYFGLLDPRRLDAEISATEQDYARDWDEPTKRRLTALIAARENLLHDPGEA